LKTLIHFLFFFLTIVITLFSIGCESDENNPTQPVTTGTIQGKVTNSIDESVIEGASVQTDPPSSAVTTDQSGNYVINNVLAGTYSVTASKTGFDINSANISVVAGKSSTANIQLTKSARNVNGSWEGILEIGGTLTLTLTQNGNSVTGTGFFVQGSFNVACTVPSGSCDGSIVSLTIDTEGFIPFTYLGTFTDDNVHTGHLNGSGFTNESITFTKL
jgi:hypothetical protein